MNFILLSSLTVVSAGIGFAKFEQTNPDLRIENVEHSLKHNHARLSVLVSSLNLKFIDLKKIKN